MQEKVISTIVWIDVAGFKVHSIQHLKSLNT